MNSKEEILSRIRRNTGTRHGMPDLVLQPITYADPWEAFAENLAAAGGKALRIEEGESVEQAIRKAFPEAKRVASNLPGFPIATFNPDELDDPRELDGTDLAVVAGEFAVAENGAVWIPCQARHKALYFIPEALVILIPRERVVCHMHEAYRLVAERDYPYGVFMSGPSKTADIEQALVFGAHGPVRVIVIGC